MLAQRSPDLPASSIIRGAPPSLNARLGDEMVWTSPDRPRSDHGSV